jgi:hypothetical protein
MYESKSITLTRRFSRIRRSRRDGRNPGGVGVQYGTQFFIGLTSRGGLRANMIALTGVLAAGALSLAFMAH